MTPKGHPQPWASFAWKILFVLGNCSGYHGVVSRSFFRMEAVIPLDSGVVTASCRVPFWELPLVAGTCLAQGDTSSPGEATSKDQLCEGESPQCKPSLQPHSSPRAPRWLVEAFADVASHSNSPSAQCCGPHSPAGVGFLRLHTRKPPSQSLFSGESNLC